MPIDESLVDNEGMQQYQADQLNYLDNSRQQEEARQELQKQDEQVEAQALSEQADPRNADQWGLKAVAKELQTVAAGGIQDTASSMMTFPERTVDALTGEIQRERKEKGYYRPEWDPLVDHDNPIVTKTWWGKLLRGTVHFGTMAAALIPTFKVTAARLGIAGTGIMANSLVRAAGIGAVSDLISKESDGENALGMLRDRYGFIDTPLSTRETDHPIMMKLKNIVEGMGIGLVFDNVAMALGKGNAAVRAQVEARRKSVDLQTLRKGIQEVRRNEFGFRGSKNKPIADPSQAAHISEEDPFIVWAQQKKIREDWGAQEGSTGSVTTPVQRERVAREADISEDLVDETLQKLLSSQRYQSVLKSVGGSRKRLVEVFGDSIAAHQRITQGRNAADMDAAEYLKELFESYDVFDGGTDDAIKTLTSKNVVVADLITGSLLHQLRDLGIAGREIADFADLGDIDGPADQIVDTMLTLLTEVKKARIVKSQNFRELGAGKKKQFLEENLSQDMADTRESIMSILQIAKDDPDENMLNALFEAFSSMKTVNSVDDFDNWARKMIIGGEIEGKKQTGAVVRELGGVMTHSILSGPKTPLRAVMGTSTATFLRPLSTTLGAAMRYPFGGDAETLRAGMASINAMMQAIPESWTLFRSKLDSYWSGDISTVKTRFSEYTRSDENWELLRKWAENPKSGATDGDRAWFNMANMARSMNDNKFLSYSTKLMAATDDAFAYILGRAKMREKAMRSAMDAQNKGALTAYSEITPELVRVYEEDFYRDIFDGDGNIIDDAVKWARKEVTLTEELNPQGFAGGLNSVFQANPWAKPFFLFARTGVNGLKLTAKHTPGFNFLVQEFNDIAFANAKNLDAVAKYGITSAQELANAKALQTGRLAMGSSLTMMAIGAWMRGDLTGNGPVDRQKRQVWLDSGYKPRHIKLGGLWVGYESIEPFNQIMAIISDVGDASQLMGEEWTEDQFQKISLVIAQGITSKSYLAGMSQFVDLFAGRPGQWKRIVANLGNNTVPLAGLRNELGKVFTPYTRELGSGVFQAIRNRNLISEHLPGADLPIKYDILTGRPIKDWDPLTRMFNAVSPISLSLDNTPGRTLLFNSGYDMRLSTYYSPRGEDLSDAPLIRSMFQQAIGMQNLERKLDKLAEDPKIIQSLEIMQRDIQNGDRGNFEATDYYHNGKIEQIFNEARRKAWASIMYQPEVQVLINEQKEANKRRYQKTKETANIINMYK